MSNNTDTGTGSGNSSSVSSNNTGNNTEEDILDSTTTEFSGPIATINPNYALDNERLDCDNIDELMSTRFPWIEQPSFITVLLRFFGNMFVDIFKAIFS